MISILFVHLGLDEATRHLVSYLSNALLNSRICQNLGDNPAGLVVDE